jgi:hypothetical protein
MAQVQLNRPKFYRQRSCSEPPADRVGGGRGLHLRDAVEKVKCFRGSLAAMSPSSRCFTLCGQGAGGVDELRGNLDDSQIRWALVRFSAGKGTFQQEYVVAINFLGQDSNGFARQQMRQELQTYALQVFGSVSRELMLDNKDDVTLEGLKRKLLIREDCEQWKAPRASFVARPKELPEDLPEEQPDELIYRPQSGEAALQEISSGDGKWNWALFGPDPNSMFIAGGADSAEGLIEALKARPNEVLYGWIRLAFGDEAHRQTQLVFVHWGGPGVSPGTRFKHSLVKPTLLSKLDISAGLDLHTADELSLESFLNPISEGSDHPEAFTREEFEKARQVGPPPEPAGEGEQDLQEAVASVKNGPLNWLLLAPDQDWKKGLKEHKQRRGSC